MALAPIKQAFIHNRLKNLRLIATDLDGTLTQQGKFTARLLHVFETLQAANLPVLIVTGRSAGWVSGLVAYLPIAGAIAENGGLFYPSPSDRAIALTQIPELRDHRQQLAATFQHLKTEFPQIQESTDNRFRLTDWTFDNHNLTQTHLARLEMLCRAKGWGFTYSSVQCHIKPLFQDKATGLMQVLRDYFSPYTLEQVMTVGDSPNDASLFNPQLFPFSVGVANVLDYTEVLAHQPAYVTTAAEGAGFCELADCLIASSVDER